jgi:transposase InsO family protein
VRAPRGTYAFLAALNTGAATAQATQTLSVPSLTLTTEQFLAGDASDGKPVTLTGLPDERRENACGFLVRAVSFFAAHGVSVERVMTDNGSAYRSHAFRARLAALGCRHLRTRPYTPRTNGKAERFIQTSLREWAYAAAYASSAEREAAMPPWITRYNHCRPHSALGGKPPVSRLNNVPGFDS